MTWTLDALVQECTAFASWGDMVASMANGYVPTLNGGPVYEAMARTCRAWGFKVFRNGKVS
jgi:hypothetical protein